MKSSDLRIGNYVWGASDRIWGVSDRIECISELHRDKVETTFRGHLYNYSLYEDISPIGLTPEILEKAGARWLPHGYFIGKLKFTYEHNELSQFVRFHYSGKVVYLKYVHELQNLVFALTQKEITLTF